MSLALWATPAITDTLVQPDTPADALRASYVVRACRGQYVPLSLCIRSTSDVTLTIKSPEHEYLTVDPYWVVRWWQSPKRYGATEPVMLPELLLHDPALVTPMPDKTNVVRQPILDTDEIEPLTLKAETTQQVWLDLHVPSFCPSRRYRVTIEVMAERQGFFAEMYRVPILVDVLPFALAASPITYSVFYRGQLYGGNYDRKTRYQYESEIWDMAAHGVTHPVCYENFDWLYKTAEDINRLKALLAIWHDAGLKTDRLYIINTPFTIYPDMDLAKRELAKLVGVLRDNGVERVYVQGGVDEPTPEGMTKLVPYLEAKQAAGAKTFLNLTGASQDALDILGRRMDQPQFSDPTIDLAPWKALGCTPWLYHAVYWPSGETHYRRFFGLDAWRHGWSGCAPYAYQHKFGVSVWNDMDHFYPDHVFAYPTHGEPIATLQWESYAEGIADVRYAQTLIDAGGNVPDHEGKSLDAWREDVIGRILERC